MFSTIKALSLVVTFASCLFWPIQAFQEQAGNITTNTINMTHAKSVESFLQTDWLEAQAKNGAFRDNPERVLNILERSQCGIVYITGGYGSGSITATFLGAGDRTKESFAGNGGTGATTEYLSKSDWWAIEFDVSEDICIYEMYIACGSQAHKSNRPRYQKWTAQKINNEGVDKTGKSWWKGDGCYHIGWFKVREDYMDWAPSEYNRK
jgi:hypothetical protein